LDETGQPSRRITPGHDDSLHGNNNTRNMSFADSLK
jgi:hypothetical protein